MVHSAVTAVRYESVSLAGIGGRRRRTTSSIEECTTPQSSFTTTDAASPINAQEIGHKEDEDDGEGSKSMWYGEKLSLDALRIEESYYSKEREHSPRAASSPSAQPPLKLLDDSQVAPNEFSAHTPPASVDGAAADNMLKSCTSQESDSDDFMLLDAATFDGFSNSDTDDVTISSTPPRTPTRRGGASGKRSATTPESTKVNKTPTKTSKGFLPLRKNSSGSFNGKKSSGLSIAMMNSDSGSRRQISLGSVFEYDSRPRSVSAAGLEVDDIEKLLELYSAPLIINHALVVQGSQRMLEKYALSRGVSKRETKFALIDSDNQRCYLEEHASQILAELTATDSITGVMSTLQQHLEECNAQTSIRWSLLLQALPRVMPVIRDDMRLTYLMDIRVFWKGQMVVHTYNRYCF